MKRHTYRNRLLAALLAVYAAVGMCRTATALMEENRRAEVLRRNCQELTAKISACKDSAESAPLRVQAWRQFGMVSPEDTVFFDAG